MIWVTKKPSCGSGCRSFSRKIQRYGKEGEGFGHFALGRGHLALQEYPQALVEPRAAQKLGVERPELHYALGLVLGKHFDQAMHEARLAGGGTGHRRSGRSWSQPTLYRRWTWLRRRAGQPKP